MTKTVKICDRIFGALNFKIIMVVATLLTAIPLIHDYIGGYLKIFLLYGIATVLYTAIRRRRELVGLFIGDKANLLLALFLISYAATVVLNRSGHFSENVNQLIYMGVFFCLMFVFPSTLEKEQAEKEAMAIARTAVVMTFVFSVISFITFVFLINGSLFTDGKLVYFGMQDNRLWGLYNPNTGSMLCILSMLFSLGLFLKKEHRGFNVANAVLQYLCLLLTGSRSALYILYVIVFAAVTVGVYKLAKSKKALKGLILGAVAVVTVIGVGKITRVGLSYIPGTVKFIEQAFTSSETDEPYEFEIFDLTRIEEGEASEGGFFSGRTYLWKAGIRALEKSPVLGIGRENVADEAVKYLEKENYVTNLYVGGLHNIYITVLVSSGAVGFIILALFAALTSFRWLKNPIKGKKTGVWYGIFAIMTVAFYVTELVEARILYQVGIFYVLFWTALGLLNALALRADESEEK